MARFPVRKVMHACKDVALRVLRGDNVSIPLKAGSVMRKFSFKLQELFFAVAGTFCLATLCVAPMAAPAQAAPATRSAQDQAADDALLNKARTLYYSTAKAGLTGFDCTVDPDWLATFVKANPGTTISSDDSRVVLLKRVAMALHANLKDASVTLDWTPPSVTLTSDQTNLLTQMHSASQQSLGGFIQFWTPFVDGTVIPANSSGMTVTHSVSSFTIHADANGTSVTETFSNDLLLEHYDVITDGTSVKFEPSYKATPQGLLVEHFVAYIQKADDPSAPIMEMHVAVQYQPIDGFPIPSRLDMEVVGTGVFNMALNQCTVRR
jgi:hypothetical protein